TYGCHRGRKGVPATSGLLLGQRSEDVLSTIRGSHVHHHAVSPRLGRGHGGGPRGRRRRRPTSWGRVTSRVQRRLPREGRHGRGHLERRDRYDHHSHGAPGVRADQPTYPRTTR